MHYPIQHRCKAGKHISYEKVYFTADLSNEDVWNMDKKRAEDHQYPTQLCVAKYSRRISTNFTLLQADVACATTHIPDNSHARTLPKIGPTTVRAWAEQY